MGQNPALPAAAVRTYPPSATTRDCSCPPPPAAKSASEEFAAMTRGARSQLTDGATDSAMVQLERAAKEKAVAAGRDQMGTIPDDEAALLVVAGWSVHALLTTSDADPAAVGTAMHFPELRAHAWANARRQGPGQRKWYEDVRLSMAHPPCT